MTSPSYRSEDGFTLIELLAVMLISIVVMLAALGLMEASGRSTDRINDKVDTAQRGRLAITEVGRQLRAQTCVSIPATPAMETKPPIVAGDDSSVTFYNQIDGDPTFRPTMRRIAYDATAKTLTMSTWTPSGSSASGWTFAEANRSNRTIANGVVPIRDASGAAVPVFRFRGFDTGLDTPRTPFETPLSPTTTNADGSALPSNSAARVVRVDTGFRIEPAGNSNRSTDYEVRSRQGDFTSTVYLRNAQYNDQTAAGATDTEWGAGCE